MSTRLSTSLALAFYAMFHPLLAFAQQPSQQWQMPCPMWSGEWGFWWMGPIMFIALIAACATFFLLGRLSARRPS